MVADPSIYQSLTPAPKSVLDYQTDLDNREALRTRNALQNLALQTQTDQVQQGLAERNALRRVAASWTPQSTVADRVSALRATGMPGLMQQADALETADLNRRKTDAEINDKAADTAKKTFGLTQEKRQAAIQRLVAFQNPQDAMTDLQASVQRGEISAQDAQAMAQRIPQDPAQFGQWQLQNLRALMSPEQAFNASKPVLGTRDTGGAIQNIAIDPLTGKPTVTATTGKTVSPDTAANNATSRANNQANITKDLQIAGLSSDGTGVNQNVEQMAQAIAAGRAAPITGFALAKPQGQTVMRRVFEINPTYDETTYGAKQKAARDFTSGTQGNALRSVSTANEHLNQLGDLVDAMGNGDMQIVNRVGNYFATQTGNPKATNFDAIKNIVGQEVVKAIVAGGGSAGERDEAAHAFSTANSPAQLKGAIEHYRMVMGAQASNLMEQRRAAGLPDSTLPNYNKGGRSKVMDDADAILNGGSNGKR